MDSKRKELSEKQNLTLAEDFWNDQKRAESVLKEISSLKYWVGGMDSLQASLSDLEVLVGFGADAEADAQQLYDSVLNTLENM
ncbi:MAG: PCRF domain-containing protein, partial [Bacteroidales bacterium]|nr:PCRF domain-containing protein [Bacteroidales bacterium]